MRYTGCSQSKFIMKYFILTWLLSLLLTCIVTNAAHLIRTRPDGKEFWGDNYTVTEGGELTIPCNSQQMPSDSMVVAFNWNILERQIGAREIPETALIAKRARGKAYTLRPLGVKPRLLPNTRTLNIKNITKYFNGTYRCLVISLVGKVKPKKYIEVTYFGVEVKAAARIDSTMKMSIHLTVGQKLELDCTSSGNPPPKVTWRRIDGPKLNEDRTIQHNKGLLSMHGVGQADRGKYQCFASNSLGNDSRTFLVDVRVPATIITKEISYATIGEDGRVKCEAFGNPPPTFVWTWYKGQHSPATLSEIETQGRFSVETVHTFERSICYLNIKNVKRSDFHDYVCNAKNFHYTNLPILLKAYDVPGRPSIETMVAKANEIYIGWSYGNDGGKKVNSVIIEYALDNVSRWESVSIKNPKFQHYTIKNLVSQTSYKVRVYTANELGKSGPSAERYGKTQLGVPNRPTISKVIPKGRGISIVWSYGDDDGGKRINSVIIEYALKNTSRWGSVFVQNYPQVQHYTFNNLRPHTSYKFRVYAVNEIGKSSASAMRFGTTQLGVPKRPTIWKVIPKSRAINIVWSYGDDGGKRINSVIIEYAFTNAIRWESVKIENYPQVQHYTFKNLRPHTSYKFRVYAVNEIGKSSASVIRFGSTQLGVPEKPTIRTVIAKDREIRIGWTHGDDGGVKIHSVIIEYMLKNNSKWKSVLIVNPQVTRYTIKDLRPKTSYKFRVYAVNEIGKSNASIEICGTTTGTSLGFVTGKKILAKRLNMKETIGAVTGGFLILVIATVIVCISLRKTQRKSTKKAAKEAQRVPQSNKQNQDIKGDSQPVHI